MHIIGIAGGSGCGKSTVSVALCKKYPETFALIHVDDYFKKKEEVPLVGQHSNWDHPEALRMDDLYRDICSLKAGQSIKITTKSELYNPDYDRNLKNKIEYEVVPKPFLILEGYLALHDSRLRDLMGLKIYLDIPVTESTKRRSGNKFAFDPDYFETVLAPMHREFVEPTRQYADICLDVSNKNAAEVFNIIEKKIFDTFS